MKNTNTINTNSLETQREILINREELDKILDNSINSDLLSKGKEIVLWNKDSLMNLLNSKFSSLNKETLVEKIAWYQHWRNENIKLNLKYDELWDKVRNKELISDIINEKRELNSSNIFDYNKFLHINKETILSRLTTQKK